MIDHVVINVADLGRSRRFYEKTLAVFGYAVQSCYPEAVGFGEEGKPDFWIVTREPLHRGVHVAFASADRATVDRFYEVARSAGGRANGPPGVRTIYHPHYYGAYVLDPDGNNIEAVCHRPAGDAV